MPTSEATSKQSIKADGAAVEMGGDEMPKIIWRFSKHKAIDLYLDPKLVSCDLPADRRDRIEDQITTESANSPQAQRRRRARDHHTRRGARAECIFADMWR